MNSKFYIPSRRPHHRMPHVCLQTVDFPFQQVSKQPADSVYSDYYYYDPPLLSVPAVSEVFLWFL